MHICVHNRGVPDFFFFNQYRLPQQQGRACLKETYGSCALAIWERKSVGATVRKRSQRSNFIICLTQQSFCGSIKCIIRVSAGLMLDP